MELMLRDIKKAVPGVTDRQVQHWAAQGYLPGVTGPHIQGYQNRYTVEDLRVVRALYYVSFALGLLPKSEELKQLIAHTAICGGNQITYREVTISWPASTLDLEEG